MPLDQLLVRRYGFREWHYHDALLSQCLSAVERYVPAAEVCHQGRDLTPVDEFLLVSDDVSILFFDNGGIDYIRRPDEELPGIRVPP
jgi:hypothetical protein